jgi:uncharacterized membrane protein
MAIQPLFKKIFQYFLQGLIIIAPLGITLWAVTSLFNFIDRILPNLMHTLFPQWVKVDQFGEPVSVPGLGFIVVIVLVFLVGWVSSTFIVGKLVDLLDTVLEKTPGIKFIYTTVKDFVEAFAGNKKKFEQAVLVNVDETDIWRVGFLTQKDLHLFGLQEHVAVYLPQSYGLVGHVFFVRKERVRLLDMSPSDAMKFVVSGSVADLEHHHH